MEEAGLRRVVVDTLVVTPSGALSPGMLSAAAVAVGAYLGALGGLAVALGHMVFELPYVGALVYWAERLESLLRRVERPLALLTLAFAAYFAYGLAASALEVLGGGSAVEASGWPSLFTSGLLGAVAAGVVFTGGNPYFLAWWLTIGMPLVRGAARYGARGFAAMYSAHVWMDYAWLALLAGAGGLSQTLGKLYAWVLLGLAALLLYFAAAVVVRAFRSGNP